MRWWSTSSIVTVNECPVLVAHPLWNSESPWLQRVSLLVYAPSDRNIRSHDRDIHGQNWVGPRTCVMLIRILRLRYSSTLNVYLHDWNIFHGSYMIWLITRRVLWQCYMFCYSCRCMEPDREYRVLRGTMNKSLVYSLTIFLSRVSSIRNQRANVSDLFLPRGPRKWPTRLLTLTRPWPGINHWTRMRCAWALRSDFSYLLTPLLLRLVQYRERRSPIDISLTEDISGSASNGQRCTWTEHPYSDSFRLIYTSAV